MTQLERLNYMIDLLLTERGQTADVPKDEAGKFRFYRALVNVRSPKPISEEYLRVEDEYLQERSGRIGVTDIADLTPVADGLYLWQGDITTLKCDGIVNAANSRMLGCFAPNHACIDNCIHTFAGVRLRKECDEIMTAQGGEEPTGTAKITSAYNLPCKYVLHTVGPIVFGALTERHEKLLASCYRSCLELADDKGLNSIAFCCISTGEFRFPNERAAEIAISTVEQYKRETESKIKVVFNVFKDNDHAIYKRLLATNK